MSKAEDNIKELPAVSLAQPAQQKEFNLFQGVQNIVAACKQPVDKPLCVFSHQVTDGSPVHVVVDDKIIGSMRLRLHNKVVLDDKTGNAYIEVYFTDLNNGPPTVQLNVDHKK